MVFLGISKLIAYGVNGGIIMQSSLFPYLLEYASKGRNHDPDFRYEIITETLEDIRDHIEKQPFKEAARLLLSTQNYIQRSGLKIYESLDAKVGDVCYIDFGQAYLNEAGYQHFGLVLASMNGKVFVVPMTSNQESYRLAYDRIENPKGKTHLMRFGQDYGLNRPTALFLNDCKFISPSRIIEIKGNLDPESLLFKRIQRRVALCLFKVR